MTQTTYVLTIIEQMRRKYKILPYLTVILVVLQLVTILFSWIVASVVPSLPCRSILSGEGIRWFLGTFVDNISGRLLAWLLLCAIAYGSFVHSGLQGAFAILIKGENAIGYRQRHALYVAVVLCVAILAVVALLVFMPDSILLGVSGSLFPSAFSAAIVPLAAFVTVVSSIAYGISSGEYAAIHDVFENLYYGIYMAAPIFPVYVLAVQLFYSIGYVLLL